MTIYKLTISHHGFDLVLDDTPLVSRIQCQYGPVTSPPPPKGMLVELLSKQENLGAPLVTHVEAIRHRLPQADYIVYLEPVELHSADRFERAQVLLDAQGWQVVVDVPSATN
jgi:hypothetical protein